MAASHPPPPCRVRIAAFPATTQKCNLTRTHRGFVHARAGDQQGSLREPQQIMLYGRESPPNPILPSHVPARGWHMGLPSPCRNVTFSPRHPILFFHGTARFWKVREIPATCEMPARALLTSVARVQQVDLGALAPCFGSENVLLDYPKERVL